MRSFVVLVVAGLLALPGCGGHRQIVRPPAEADEDGEKRPPRVINGESEAVKNWSTGDR